MTFDNQGTVQATTGTLTIGSLNQLSGTKLTGGTWIASGTGRLVVPGGNLTENDGSITLSGSGTFAQLAGLATNSGSLSLLAGNSLTITPTGGSLASPGKLLAGPGALLSVTGNLTLSSPSSVTIQLGGPTSSLFGTLSVSGTATLTGALDVTRVNDFLPSQAETFSFLTAGIESGQFASVVNLTPIDGYTYSASYVPSGTASIVVGTIPSIEAVAQLFYNNSKFDANTPGVSTSDDGAIAPDKVAYLPGAGTATSVNVSSYNKGINGIMVDLQGGGTHGSISVANILSDFTFKMGNNNTPSTWATAPSPISVSVRAGAGVGGSDRVELIWADNAIKETWLEVEVLATADTGLPALATSGTLAGVGDVFFFGSAVGDDFTGETTIAFTNATDDLDARNHPGVATITNIYDYNKDGFVNASDSLIARGNPGSIRFINISNPPSAPDADPNASPSASPSVTTAATPTTSNGDSGIASALTALATTNVSSGPIPGWIASRLSNVNLTTGVAATIIDDLAKAAAGQGLEAKLAKTILVDADKVADVLNLDDALLDSVLDDLGLQLH